MVGVVDSAKLADRLRPTGLAAMAGARRLEQRADFHAERPREPNEHADRDVVAGLHASKVAGVDLHLIGEPLLNPASFLAQLDDALPEVTADALCLVHPCTIDRLSVAKTGVESPVQ